MAEFGKWISVKDKLPGYDEDVLITNGEWYDFGFYHPRYCAWYRMTALHSRDAVTHWMPLPELPKEDA